MTRSQLLERIMFAVDGYRFGEWDLAEAGERITRLIMSNPAAAAGCDSEIDTLIEASSLGTASAKAFRESVSDEDVDRIMDRVNETTSAGKPDTRKRMGG